MGSAVGEIECERSILPVELFTMSHQPVPLVSRMLSLLSLLCQTVASGCWIASVFLYRIENGEWHRADVLQLAAASAWLVANIASLLKPVCTCGGCVRCLEGGGCSEVAGDSDSVV